MWWRQENPGESLFPTSLQAANHTAKLTDAVKMLKINTPFWFYAVFNIIYTL